MMLSAVSCDRFYNLPTVLGCLLLALLLWRLWTFTIIPVLYSKDPKELPYWMPSMLSFNQKSYMIEVANHYSCSPGYTPLILR